MRVTACASAIALLALGAPEQKAYAILLAEYTVRPAESGLFFRLAFTPVFTAEGIGPWGRLSLGLTF